MAEHRCEAAVAPVSDLIEKAEYFPMGKLHEESRQSLKIRGIYEKQVKVRGHHHPLTDHTGRQSRPDCNGFSHFKTGVNEGTRVICTTKWSNY